MDTMYRDNPPLLSFVSDSPLLTESLLYAASARWETRMRFRRTTIEIDKPTISRRESSMCSRSRSVALPFWSKLWINSYLRVCRPTCGEEQKFNLYARLSTRDPRSAQDSRWKANQTTLEESERSKKREERERRSAPTQRRKYGATRRLFAYPNHIPIYNGIPCCSGPFRINVFSAWWPLSNANHLSINSYDVS